MATSIKAADSRSDQGSNEANLTSALTPFSRYRPSRHWLSHEIVVSEHSELTTRLEFETLKEAQTNAHGAPALKERSEAVALMLRCQPLLSLLKNERPF